MNRILRNLLVALAMCSLLNVAGGCGMQAYDLPLPGKQVSSDQGYRVTADFRDVVDVVPRTVVMANDVPIGQVDKVERVGWHARVHMTVRKDIVLPADAVADVRQTSLLGEKYIALTAPDGSTKVSAGVGRLQDGAFIGLDRTSRNPEVEEVLGALSFLLAGGGVGQLKTISTELNKMMDGRTGDMRDLLSQMNTMVGALDRQKGDIIKAMQEVNRLSMTLNKEKKAITDALDSFGPALKVLRQQHQDLMTMLRSLDKLGDVATRVINESGANITTALKELRPTLTQLAKAGDSLPRGLMMAASFPFPKQAENLAMGDYSNALFNMNFDLNKLLNQLAGHKQSDMVPEVFQLCMSYSQGCNAIQPLAKALCNLTQLEMACSVVGRKDKAPKAGAKVPKLPKIADLLPKRGTTTSGGSSKTPGLDQLIPGFASGLGVSAPSAESQPAGGLSGLLGALSGQGGTQ